MYLQMIALCIKHENNFSHNQKKNYIVKVYLKLLVELLYLKRKKKSSIPLYRVNWNASFKFSGKLESCNKRASQIVWAQTEHYALECIVYPQYPFTFVQYFGYPRSPDVSLIDLFVWGAMKNIVVKTPVDIDIELVAYDYQLPLAWSGKCLACVRLFMQRRCQASVIGKWLEFLYSLFLKSEQHY